MDFIFDHDRLTGPDGEKEVALILHRLDEEKKELKDPDLINDSDAEYAETINVSRSPYIPPA